MVFNYNETFDRVVVKKKCLVKGKVTEVCSGFNSSEQIAHIMYWARNALGPIKVYVDEATIRALRDDERLAKEEVEN